MVDFPMMPQWMFPGAGMMAGMPGVPDMDPATLNAMKWQQGFGMLSDIGAGLARAGMAGKGLGAAGLGVASGLDQNRQRRAQEQEGAFKGMLMQGQLGEMAQKQQQRQALTGWLNTPEGQKALGGMPSSLLAALPPDQQAALVMQAMKDQRLAGALPEIPGGGPSPQPQGAGAVGGAPGATDYYSALRGAESGGRNVPNAMGSGAFGPYQFMPATWAGLVQKYGQTHGLTADGLRDPQQQEKAIRLFTADNRDALKTALGRDPTPDEIYAAHRLGAAGAVKLIQAPPMAQGGALFPTYTVQNPDLNQPAGVIRDQWKARFGNLPVDTMSGGQPPQGGGAPMPQPGGQAGPVDPASDPHYQSLATAYNAARRLGDSKKALEIYTEMGKRRAELTTRESWSPVEGRPNLQINRNTGKLEAIPQQRDEGTPREFTMAQDLRKEFFARDGVKAYEIMRPSIQAIREAVPRDTRAADLNIVFAFAKMLDPTSVVREGEQVQVLKTGSLPEQIQGYIAKLNGGGMLTPEIRKSLQVEAEGRFANVREQYASARDEIRAYAKEHGLDPDKLLKLADPLAPYQSARPPTGMTPPGQPPSAPPQGGQPPAAPGAQPTPQPQRMMNPKTGEVIELRDGRWVPVAPAATVAPGSGALRFNTPTR